MAIYKWFPVRVTGVTLDKSSLIMLNAGDTQQLTATVSPANAENKSVVWSTSDATIATVDQTGLVTCVTPGNCDITVTTVDGGYTAVCGVINSGWEPSIHTLLYCPLDSTNGYADITGNHTMVARANANGYGGQPTRDSTGFYYFDGGTIETTQGYTGPQQGTMSVWFKRANKHDTWVQEWVLSAHRGGSFPYHTFAMDVGTNDTVSVVYTSNNQTILIYPGNQAIGQWILWTLTYSSTDGAKLYIDGELVDSESPDGTLYQYTEPTCIGGAYVEPYQYYEGYIADVIYEDKVWGPGQVGAWYEQSMLRYKREPTSNTVLYCPLETDIDNYSNSGLVTTGYGNYSFTTQGGVPCVYSNSGVLYNNDMGLGDNRTISCWFYPTLNNYNWQIFWDLSDTTSQAWARGCSPITNPSHYLGVYEHLGVGADNITSQQLTSSWHNIIMSYDDTGYTIYLDGQNVGTGNIDVGYNNGDRFELGYRDGANYTQFLDGYMSNLIVESRTWSADDVSVYYNQTKGDYGIS